MRLINVHTLKCKVFPEDRIPRYGILSHRWGAEKDEVTFQDLDVLRRIDRRRIDETGKFAKLLRFCDQARQRDCDYIWIDTCCIDRSSSRELQEAINAMYQWYANADVCIAYLKDVHTGNAIGGSEWFERGWTLQELIAPANLAFYDYSWKFIGTKEELAANLFLITGIPEDVLKGIRSPLECSIAQRMSWAAARRTTRKEDRAYSLLGLFNISLPLVYGHDDAFQQLQEKIIVKYNDQSLFAWALDRMDYPQGFSGLLATSPSSFRRCRYTITISTTTEFKIVNGALRIRLPTVQYDMDTYRAFLSCTDEGSPDKRCSILLRVSPDRERYYRVPFPNDACTGAVLSQVPHTTISRRIRAPQNPSKFSPDLIYGFRFRRLEPPGYENSHFQILSAADCKQLDTILCEPGNDSYTAGIIYIEPDQPSKSNWSRVRYMVFGFNAEFDPVCMLVSQKLDLISKHKRLQPSVSLTQQSQQRHYFLLDKSRWIDNETYLPEGIHKWDNGFCVIRGNKTSGLSATIEDLNLKLDMKKKPCKDIEADGSVLIWTVDVTDTGGESPEHRRRRAVLKQVWDVTSTSAGILIFGWAVVQGLAGSSNR